MAKAGNVGPIIVHRIGGSGPMIGVAGCAWSALAEPFDAPGKPGG